MGLSCKGWFWVVFTLAGVWCLEMTNFGLFLLWEDVFVMKGVTSDNFYFEEVFGFERTYFQQFSPWEDVVILKGLIINNFHFGRTLWSRRDFLTVSTLRVYGAL